MRQAPTSAALSIFLIRHAKSLSNASNVWTGQRDVPLSPEGEREQRRLCGRFCYPRAELYFSSPLARCTQSFEIIYGRQALRLLPSLCECSLGVLEGEPYTNLDDDPKYCAWLAAPELPLSGGESFNDFTRRACSGFEELLAEVLAAGIQSAAGVMHGNVMRALLHRFADESIAHGAWQIPNGGMYELSFDAAGRCRKWRAAPGFLFSKVRT